MKYNLGIGNIDMDEKGYYISFDIVDAVSGEPVITDVKEVFVNHCWLQDDKDKYGEALNRAWKIAEDDFDTIKANALKQGINIF